MYFYLKKIYPCDLICHMMTMTSPAVAIVDEEEMHVEHDRARRRDQKFYRSLGFSFSANDIFRRDKKRLVTSHQRLVDELLRHRPDQVHFGSLQLYDDWGRETRCLQELVFDIDVTDYTRYCLCGARSPTSTSGEENSKSACATGMRHAYYCKCGGPGKACSGCWLHIEGAAALLHYLLVHQLGIAEKHLLWVLSGKKGIHCLVNDPRYVGMTVQQRASLFQLLQCETVAKLQAFGRHLLLGGDSTAVQQWEELYVENVVCRRHMLANDVFARDCLDLVKQHYPALHHQLEQRWCVDHGPALTSLSKWQALKTLENGQFADQCPPSLLLVLHCYYPRIDRGPLCTRNHLIKLPFSVHRSTQNIALPVERRHIVERHGLPTLSLTLDDAIRHYKCMGKARHPDYEAACELMARWLSAYDDNK